MHKYKVLLLGLGFFGEQWIKVLKISDKCEIAGISGCSKDIGKISDMYDLPNVKAYTDYKDAIKHTDADIAIVVIPVEYHTNAAKLALERGMHVLSEKPLTFSKDDADNIMEVKRKYPELKYMVDQNYRWRPHNQTLKKAIDSGLIGKIGSIICEFRRPEDLIGYRTLLEMPLLQDVSIHHFDLIRFFTGRNCKEIFAYSYKPVWSMFDGKPSTEAIIKMEGGMIVTYTGTWAGRGKNTSWDGNFTVHGEKGCLSLDESGNVQYFKPGDAKGDIVEKVNMEYTELQYAISMFIKSIKENKMPESSLEENYHSFLMVCAAEESVRKNAPVRLK